MNKNKILTTTLSLFGIATVILLIFLILKINRLEYNIEIITGQEIVDITPNKKKFDLSLFQENLLNWIEENKPSIVWIYSQKDIEIFEDNINSNETKKLDSYNINPKNQKSKIETIKTLQWNGIIISKDWYIITNKHVVKDLKANYTVILNNQKFKVNKIRNDKWLDLAIIKISVTKQLKPAKFIDITNENKIWQIVFALKNDPTSQEIVTKMWIINSKNQKFKIENNRIYIWLIQTSTAIEPWFSGWPLININWDVIAINTAIDNIEYWASYSLPLNQEFINQTLSSIKESSKIIRPYIWIDYDKQDDSIIITKIHKNSPASKTELEIWDIIHWINNNDINYNNFLYQLYTYKPNKNIILNVQKDKFKQDIQIKLWIQEDNK